MLPCASMEYGLYLSTAGALVQDFRIEQVANNLANVNTSGFHRVLQSVQERQAESREDPTDFFWGDRLLDSMGGGALLARTLYDRSAGPVVTTGGKYDFAIQGGGYFAVAKPGSDQVLYTRSGNFQVGEDGVLRTADSEYEVLDVSGQRIELDAPDENLALRLQVREFAPTARMNAAGAARYLFEGEGTLVGGEGRIRQGALEQNTVSAVTEMVEMIEALRAYEANTNMIRSQAETLGRAVNEIGRPSR